MPVMWLQYLPQCFCKILIICILITIWDASKGNNYSQTKPYYHNIGNKWENSHNAKEKEHTHHVASLKLFEQED